MIVLIEFIFEISSAYYIKQSNVFVKGDENCMKQQKLQLPNFKSCNESNVQKLKSLYFLNHKSAGRNWS